MRALLLCNAAALVLRGRTALQEAAEAADVPECYPFRGSYHTGCEFVHNMCELSSYTEDPANPSWCSQYNRNVLTAWKDCEMDVRLADARGEKNGSDYGPPFVSCFTAKTEPPDCDGICANHSGACQILCPAMSVCYTGCRDEAAANVTSVRDRYDMMNCVNMCLLQQPTPPPPNEFWPDTKNASFPPEAVAHQQAMAEGAQYLASAEANYTAQTEQLEASKSAQGAIKDELHELLKMAMGIVPVPTTEPPPSPNVSNASNVSAPPPTAAPAAATTPAPTTTAPIGVAIANSPILKSWQVVDQQTELAKNQTAAVEAETEKLQQQVEDLKAQLGLPA